MNAQEYEVMSHLKEVGAGSGKDAKFDVSQFDMDVIKLLEKQRYIKTTPKRDMAGLTGLGLVAITTAAEKRKREGNPYPAPAPDSNMTVEVEVESIDLSDTQFNALTTLREMGADVRGVKMDLHHITRKSLEKLGLIKYDGVRIWLTDEGYKRFMDDLRNKGADVPHPDYRYYPVEEALSDVPPAESAGNGSAMDVSGLDNADSVVDPIENMTGNFKQISIKQYMEMPLSTRLNYIFFRGKEMVRRIEYEGDRGYKVVCVDGSHDWYGGGTMLLVSDTEETPTVADAPPPPNSGEEEKRVWLGAGCAACNGTGYARGIYGNGECSKCGGTGDNPNLRHECVDDCEECVYREVVALLSDKYPEVGELAAAMRTKKKVLARLKLGG